MRKKKKPKKQRKIIPLDTKTLGNDITKYPYVEIYLNNSIGIGEHSDILETIEKELEVIAKYDDQLHVLRKYF